MPSVLEGAAFYEAVGRPDLAESYRQRHGLRVASRVVGGIALGVGLVAWTAISTTEVLFDAVTCQQNTPPSCPDRTQWGPDILMASGLALLILPALWSNDPVSGAEKDALWRRAAEHAGVASVGISVAPLPGAGGGTLGLQGRF